MFRQDLFKKAYNLINKNRHIIKKTNLEYNLRLSKKYNCKLYFKREDQQSVRSFKIRGAFHKIYNNRNVFNTITTVSAGNHAQGVALTSKVIKKK